MIEYNSPVFELNISKCIHWYASLSAIGKSYLPEFLRQNGILDIKVHVIDSRDLFDSIDGYIKLLRDRDMIFIDRGDLYLTNQDLRNLAKYKNIPILIDMKSGVPYELREVGCPVRLDYDGRKMVLKDAYESAASFLSK